MGTAIIVIGSVLVIFAITAYHIWQATKSPANQDRPPIEIQADEYEDYDDPWD